MKVRKLPVEVEAHQWEYNGDHPEDDCTWIENRKTGQKFMTEGKVVRYFRRPGVNGRSICEHCHNEMGNHGWIDTFEGGHIACPGDWIITSVNGDRYPIKPDVFEKIYERVD